MSTTKYMAGALRRNLPGLKNYAWIAKYSNGSPMLFESGHKALEYADSVAADPSHGLFATHYIPTTVEVTA